MSRIVFLGVEGAGKTTLMMALAKELERRKADGLYLKLMTRDSFRFLKMLPEKIGEGSFPHQTASLRDLSWEIEENGTPICELSMLDYPGEIYRLAFLDAKDESDSEAFRQKVAANKAEIDALLNAVKAADNIFVLFNLADAKDLGNNPRNLDAVWVTNACLHLLKNLESKPTVEILFTQADRYESTWNNAETFSLESIDLLGHDHADVPWSYISAIAPHDSKCGIDVLIKKVHEYSTFRQRAAALRINDFDFNSCYKLFGSFWSNKASLDFFGAEIASQVLKEASCFYDSFSSVFRSILDKEFELSSKIQDFKCILSSFALLHDKRLSTDDISAPFYRQDRFTSEYGRTQAKSIWSNMKEKMLNYGGWFPFLMFLLFVASIVILIVTNV